MRKASYAAMLYSTSPDANQSLNARVEKLQKQAMQPPEALDPALRIGEEAIQRMSKIKKKKKKKEKTMKKQKKEMNEAKKKKENNEEEENVKENIEGDEVVGEERGGGVVHENLTKEELELLSIAREVEEAKGSGGELDDGGEMEVEDQKEKEEEAEDEELKKEEEEDEKIKDEAAAKQSEETEAAARMVVVEEEERDDYEPLISAPSKDHASTDDHESHSLAIPKHIMGLDESSAETMPLPLPPSASSASSSSTPTLPETQKSSSSTLSSSMQRRKSSVRRALAEQARSIGQGNFLLSRLAKKVEDVLAGAEANVDQSRESTLEDLLLSLAAEVEPSVRARLGVRWPARWGEGEQQQPHDHLPKRNFDDNHNNKSDEGDEDDDVDGERRRKGRRVEDEDSEDEEDMAYEEEEETSSSSSSPSLEMQPPQPLRYYQVLALYYAMIKDKNNVKDGQGESGEAKKDDEEDEDAIECEGDALHARLNSSSTWSNDKFPSIFSALFFIKVSCFVLL